MCVCECLERARRGAKGCVCKYLERVRKGEKVGGCKCLERVGGGESGSEQVLGISRWYAFINV